MNPENLPIPENSNQPQSTTSLTQQQAQDNKKAHSSKKPLWHKIFLILLAIIIVADLYTLYLIASEIYYAYFGCPGSIGGGECGWGYFAAILSAALYGFPLALFTGGVLFGFFKTKPSDKAK